MKKIINTEQIKDKALISVQGICVSAVATGAISGIAGLIYLNQTNNFSPLILVSFTAVVLGIVGKNIVNNIVFKRYQKKQTLKLTSNEKVL